MFTSVSAGVGDIPCFPTFLFLRSLIKLKISNFSLNLFAYFFLNIIITGKPMHTASKERMAPELMFSSERAPQLSKLLRKCSGHYASLSAMFGP